jgi:Ni,Fe-hydrogenase I small subunit
MYHTCIDCGENNFYECNQTKVERIVSDEKYNAMFDRIQKKIIDLQKHIITAYTDPTSAIANNPNDVLRYTAMVEALEAMIN